MWVSTTLQTLKPRLVHMTVQYCWSATPLTINNQNDSLVYHVCSRFYVGQRPYLLVADLEMVKQVTVKEFNSFVDREVSNLHHFVYK